MVLGLKSKKKGTKFKVEYYVNVQEIKPWLLLSQSSLNSVQLQWVNGNKSSGLLSTSVVNGMVGFNESFALRVTLRKEKKTHNVFLKNNLEFYLYESQQEKLGRGQLLGTAIVNLADYGVIRENINIDVPLNCKKIAKSSVAQPVLFLNVKPSDMESSTPSFGSLSNATSLDHDGGGGGEDYDDDRSEVASFTDDDEASSHSSKTFSSLSPLRQEVAQGKGKFHENSQLSARFGSVDKAPTPIPTESIYSELEAMTSYDSLLYGKEKTEPQANGHTTESLFGKSSTISARKNALRSETLTSRRLEEKSRSSSKLKHMKSVQISFNSARINGLFGVGIQKTDKTKETDNQQEDIQNNATIEEKGSTSVVANEWKSKVNMLEEELKETAVLEAALYSIVSEHCSSTNKVHSPARRLSRFYIHAFKSTSLATKASAAKAAVSGFILVSRSCGNDVPRLTFWLSNLIMMRATVNQAIGNVSSSCENVKANNSGCGKFVRAREKMNLDKKKPLIQELDDWEHPQTFITAMEKVEAWIFFRIVESVWWQTLTPHMQPKSGKNSCKRSNSRKTRYVLGGQEQGNSSIELWRKAFKDAGERLCPIRAGGHECGCLPVISQLVMEQLVNRLDVAMFNAILRESDDEMPTDPISDPITDSRVLPIPAGKSGFGAGAQLKNAVGNWSRWLTDLFGVEDIDSLEENDSQEDDYKPTTTTAFKSFRLLNALSELMMLPIGMLADDSTRKEVCPLLGPMIIKRVLHNFVPDEFSPRPIPRAVFNSLDSVVDDDEEEEEVTMITRFPCIASNGAGYLPPLATISAEVTGAPTLRRTTSSFLKKSYTSDDELDELDSPLTSINLDKPRQTNYPASLKPNWMPRGGRNSVRYQLLRQVWEEAQ